MTSLIAVLIGVSVFVISQYFLKLVMEPITRVRRAMPTCLARFSFAKERFLTQLITWRLPMNYDESHPSCVQPSQKSVATRSYLVSASLEFPQDQTLVMLAGGLT
jgi:hypothetical protein